MISIIIVGIFFLLLFSFDIKTDYYHPKFWLLVQSVLILLSYKIYLLSSIPVSLFFLYLSSSANWYSMNTFSNHISGKASMRQFGRTLISIFSIMIVFIEFKHEWFESYKIVAPYLLIIGCLLNFLPAKWQMRKGTKSRVSRYYTFAGNPSVGPSLLSLIAATTLFNINTITIISLLMCLIALLRMKGSAGLGGFIAALLTYTIITYPLYGWISATILLTLVPIILKFIPRLLDPSGRIEIIKYSFKNLYGINGKIFGTGLGSYAHLMPIVAIRSKEANREGVLKRQIFIWMHCDVLQFVIEGGYIGVILLLLLLSDVGVSLYYAPAAFTAFAVAYIVNSLTNFINHLAPDALIVIMMLRFLQGV